MAKNKSNPVTLRKPSLVEIALSTLEKIQQGSYGIEGKTFNLSKTIEEMKSGTQFFSEASSLSKWMESSSLSRLDDDRKAVQITLTECSTLVGARTLYDELHCTSTDSGKRIGVLNFASAKNPGGGFQTGAQAQEESIARSSTIYPSLMTDTAQQFYKSHRKNPGEGYYSHAMIFSPRVLLMRTDNGEWHEPFEVDIVTSCAVNAGVVRRYLRARQSRTDDDNDESSLDVAMKERMARVLCLFEKQGVRNIVLGSFGTGVFRNRVGLVAGIWKELLGSENARFRYSFDRVIFAVPGNATYMTFKEIFQESVTNEGSHV